MANTVQIPVVDLKGKEVARADAVSSLFGVVPNEAAVHLVRLGQQWSFYKKLSATKTRSAVSGGGRKIRKQKGSGMSRQGGNRAPHWVGGGVCFGPQPLKRKHKLNRKLKNLALSSVLSDRLAGGQVLVLKGDIKEPKTKLLGDFLGALSLNKARVGFVVTSDEKIVTRMARNLKKTAVLSESKWTPLDFLKADSLIFTEEAFKKFNEQFGSKK